MMPALAKRTCSSACLCPVVCYANHAESNQVDLIDVLVEILTSKERALTKSYLDVLAIVSELSKLYRIAVGRQDSRGDRW